MQVFRSARAAEAEYERAARRLAPLGSSERSGTCDEYVGRFCIYYDSGRDTLPAEPPEIKRVRERALERLRTAFDLNSGRAATALPLVRLLLENKQPSNALAVARRFREASADRPTATMLLTLALHASREIEAAERTIEAWLAAVDSSERRRLSDIRWLLDSREEKRYRELTGEARTDYERRFWRYADALYLTPGNETRTEHFARHAESRLIRAAPSVLGSTGWGSDVAELTMRFGTPKARTRLWETGMGSSELSLIEHWDPEQMIYAPPDLDSVLRVRARPGGGWPMDTIRTISGHAPPTVRRMLPLEHQTNVFRSPPGQWVLRVDGALTTDSARAGANPYRQGLYLLDERLGEVAAVTTRGSFEGDTLFFGLEVSMPVAARFYSAEILEQGTRLAARARFPIDRPVQDRGLILSSILIAEPFAPGDLPSTRHAVTPLPSLILPSGEPFGVYAEVTLGAAGLDSAQVELELISIDGSPALVRAGRWLGQRLGLGGEPPPPQRLGWKAQVTDSSATAVAVTIDPGNLKAGRYIVEMAVAHAGRRVESRREVLFSDSVTSSRQP